MKLFEPTPEGRIILSLLKHRKKYSDLLKETKLSRRWLAIKLKNLIEAKIVYQDLEGRYCIDQARLQLALSNTKDSLARLASLELASDREVIAIVLFGSTAKGKATEESDVDLLIIVEREKDLGEKIFEIELKLNVQIEVVVITFSEFLQALRIKPPLLFGVIEGYEVLFDRGGIKEILREIERDLKKEWFYSEELDTWLRKTLKPSLAMQRNI